MPLVGVLELTSKFRYGITSHGTPIYLFKPYDTNVPELVVGSNTRELSRNQIALVDWVSSDPEPEIQTVGARSRANLIRLIGPVGDFEAEKKALLLHHSQNPKLKHLVELEYEDTSIDNNRITLCAETGWFTYHIDPPGCKDIDDAIAYNKQTEQTAITIADVTTYVRPESDLDKSARDIGSTFYDLDGHVVLPMLPTTISEEKASLVPGKKRRGITLIIDRDGKERFVPSWIIVENSFTYDMLPNSHDMIEYMMIRYNRSVAKILKENNTGILRAQSWADASEVGSLADIDPSLTFLANEAARYVCIVPGIEEDTSHASLGLDAYCHASSPIRRYADLVNQRILKSILAGTTVPSVDETLEKHLNHRLKANRQWTRDLTFLTHVTPGKVHQIDVIWISDVRLWVPEWRRIIRARHQRPAFVESDGVGQKVIKDRISIYCDPTKRCWKDRVLTSK